jgi:hypothetical protein
MDRRTTWIIVGPIARYQAGSTPPHSAALLHTNLRATTTLCSEGTRSSATDGRSWDSGRGSRMCSTRNHIQRRNFPDLRMDRKTTGSSLWAASDISDNEYERVPPAGRAFRLALARAAVFHSLEIAGTRRK